MEIDVSGVRTSEALHDVLAQSLSFPAHYGGNWDAFWDCIVDPEQSQMPALLRLKGWSTLNRRLPSDARLLRETLGELARIRPECSVQFV